MKTKYKYTNKLINESSPYLLQHAHNPVDWYPWSDKALEKSLRENKPIFLSIGYSACHWCHVMERESFENEEIAGILNKHFVSIKVDREVRPDLDEIYMNAVQLLTGGGGWPLSVFLTPDLKPFYGGTYFPPEDNFGRTGFKTLLLSIAKAWNENRNDIIENSSQFANAIKQYSENSVRTKQKFTEDIFEKGTTDLLSAYDPKYGGFGSAPKFPQSMAIEFLMHRYTRTENEKLLNIITTTLNKMAYGGIYDHLGGGFHRYSTDKKWLVPHFEKMLYDNALLSDIYLKAFQLTGNTFYKTIAKEILDYVLREMIDTSGGFHSSQDADSYGEEGKFYLWEYQEIIDVLGEKDGSLFCDYYSVVKSDNFTSREEYHADQNILHKKNDHEPIEYGSGIRTENIQSKIDSMRKTLYNVRLNRHPLGKDDKIITAWNSLMISSLVHGFQILGNKRYLSAAEKSARFILSEMFKNGNLLRIYRQGKVKQPGYLDDYAYFISSLIDLYEATFNITWLLEAEKLTDKMIENFWDDQDGAFFFTAAVHEIPITRTKPIYDGSVPSGNSIAAYVLLRLSKLLDKKVYYSMTEKILPLFSDEISQTPRAYMSMLKAADFNLYTPKEIALAGKRNSHDLKSLLSILHSEFIPNRVIALLDNTDAKKSTIETKIPLLKGKKMASGKATAYVCKNFVCQLPVSEPEGFRKMLLAN